MSFLSKVELKKQLRDMGIKVEGNYVRKKDINMILASKKVKAIPKNWPVQPLKLDQEAKDRVTCGYCGLSWDDAIVTSITPTPSGRCPFESFHIYEHM